MNSIAHQKTYRVGIIPHAAYSLAFGGMEVQQEATISALKAIGVDVVRFDVWSTTLDVDVVHVFGSEYPHTEVIERLTALKIPTVVTAMFMPERPMWMFRAWRTIDAFLPSTTYSLRRRSLSNANAVIALSEFEKRNIHKAYGTTLNNIHVVANGVDDRFFTATPDQFVTQYGLKDFVLCVGSIDPRKNQLTLAQAMIEAGFSTVFIGNPSTHGGTKTTDYTKRFRAFVANHSNVIWIEGLKHSDPLLASAYAAAKVHVLVSTAEAQGLVSLEAAAAGCEIVVSDLSNLRELFGDGARYAHPENKEEIIRAVGDLMKTSHKPAIRDKNPGWLQTWGMVAMQLDKLYRSVLSA